MTLGTYIRIDKPVDPRALLDHLTVLVGGDPATVERRERPGMVGNALGQGLAAIVDVTYGLDGPLDMEYLDHPDSWSVENEPDVPFVPAPRALVQVGLDTGYSYRDALGRGCEELHRDLANAVAEFAGCPVQMNMDIYDAWEQVG